MSVRNLLRKMVIPVVEATKGKKGKMSGITAMAHFMTNAKATDTPLAKVKEKISAGKFAPDFSPKDNFVKYSDKIREEIKNGSKDFPKVAIPPAWKDVQINKNKYAKTWVLAKNVSKAGIATTCRVLNPVYKLYNEYKKFKRVEKFVASGTYEKVKETFRKLMLSKREDELTNDAACTLYISALTGQRIGSKKGTKAGLYDFISSKTQFKKDGTPKMEKVFVKEVDTYGISTLKVKHVAVRRGGVVIFNYYGKLAVEHVHEIKDQYLAEYMLKKIQSVKKDSANKYLEEYLFADGCYAKASKIMKKSAKGNLIKDMRTAVAFTWFPIFKEQWIAQHGEPKTKKDMKELIDFCCVEISKILGNKPSEVKKSYANPKDVTFIIK